MKFGAAIEKLKQGLKVTRKGWNGKGMYLMLQVPDKNSKMKARSLTFGEKAVGLTFNPGGDEDVHYIKALYAEIIDKMNYMRGAERSERARLLSVAITEAQTAQMWAVEAITCKEEPEASTPATCAQSEPKN